MKQPVRRPLTMTTDDAINAIDRGDIKLADLNNEDLADLIEVLRARIRQQQEGTCFTGVIDLLAHTVRHHMKAGDVVSARAWASLVLEPSAVSRVVDSN
jgi:hypothetical protein